MPLFTIQYDFENNHSARLREVNLSTGELTDRGIIPKQGVDQLRISSGTYDAENGVVYAERGSGSSGTDNHLITIDLDAPSYTDIYDFPGNNHARIAYHAARRRLYMTEYNALGTDRDTRLYVLDPDTYAQTQIGAEGLGANLTSSSPMAYRPSNNTMYLYNEDTDRLYILDVDAGTVSMVADVAIAGVQDMEFVNDVLYAWRIGPNDFVSIDTDTAAVTVIGTRTSTWAGRSLFYVPTTNPPGNFDVRLVAGQDRRAVCGWDAPDEVAGDDFVYDLRWRRAGASLYTLRSSIRVRSQIVDLGLFDTEYEFQVRARSSLATSAWVDATVMTNADSAPPVAPGDPTDLVATVDGRRVTLTWTASDPPATQYRVRYRAGAHDSWRDFVVFTPFAAPLLSWSTAYTLEVRGENGDAVSGWASVNTRTHDRPIQDPDIVLDIWDGDTLKPTAVLEDVLQYSGRFGINRGSVDDTCESMQGQVILANHEGLYDNESIRPNSRVKITHDIGGAEHVLLSGWVRSVQPHTDHSTGRKTTTLTFAGAFVQLSRQDYELALYEREVIATDDVINNVLDQVNRSDIGRAIDPGQVRLHPWSYSSILRSRSRAMGIIRAVEIAEQGYVHEERGDTVTFENRYRREIDDRPGLDWVMGTGPGEIAPMRQVAPDLGWDHVVNAVTVGGQSFRTLAPGKIATPILEATTFEPTGGELVNVATYHLEGPNRLEDDNINRDNVRAVVTWDDLAAAHITVKRNDTDAAVVPSFDDPTQGLYMQWVNRTTTSATLQIRNTNTWGIIVENLEMHGRGVGRIGKYTYGPIEDTESQQIYDRQVRNLPPTVLSDGIQHRGDTTDEGRDFVHAYLAKRSAPRASGKVPFNPFQSDEAEGFMVRVKIGDPVTCTAPTGMPPGVYYFEGMEFAFTAYPRQTIATAYLSQKGRSRSIVNNAVDVTGGADWVEVGNREVLADTDYVVGAWVEFTGMPSDDRDDEAMQIRIGERTIKVWAEEDIPTGAPGFLGASVREAVDGNAVVEVRGAGINASRWQVVRVVV